MENEKYNLHRGKSFDFSGFTDILINVMIKASGTHNNPDRAAGVNFFYDGTSNECNFLKYGDEVRA
jgi:hypothetical protein